MSYTRKPRCFTEAFLESLMDRIEETGKPPCVLVPRRVLPDPQLVYPKILKRLPGSLNCGNAEREDFAIAILAKSSQLLKSEVDV